MVFAVSLVNRESATNPAPRSPPRRAAASLLGSRNERAIRYSQWDRLIPVHSRRRTTPRYPRDVTLRPGKYAGPSGGIMLVKQTADKFLE